MEKFIHIEFPRGKVKQTVHLIDLEFKREGGAGHANLGAMCT